MRIVTSALTCLLVLTSCSDPSPPQPQAEDAQGAEDTAEDIAVDVGEEDVRIEEDVPVAELDAPDGPEAIEVALELLLEDARVEGEAPLFEDAQGRAYRLLGAGSALAWTASLPQGAANLEIEAALWRWEDAHIRVDVGDVSGGAELVLVTSAPAFVSVVEAGAVRTVPRHVALVQGEGDIRIEGVEEGGGLRVYGARLVPPREAALTAAVGPPQFVALPQATVSLEPCSEPDCEDSARLQEAVDALEDGGVIELSAAEYRWTRPVVVRSSGVFLRGAGMGQTRVIWDPEAAFGGFDAALTWRGAGDRGEGVAIVEAVQAHRREVMVDEASAFEPGQTVRLRAEDFGEVPPLCLGGRDVERENRHIAWLARVVSSEPEGDRARILLDRALSHDIPLEASPRLIPADLLDGGGVQGVSFEAACPQAREAGEQTSGALECDNLNVLNHSAVAFYNTQRGLAQQVEVLSFGRFGIFVNDSLEVRVLGGRLERPSHYGVGGRGYGVHTVRASRTLVWGFETDVARHGVVVDFGSTETVIAGCTLTRMGLASIDVHGEASLDTLMVANRLEDGFGAVIVGGGGREVHCNDGPRHHVVDNLIIDNAWHGVYATDYTRSVSVWRNLIEGSKWGLLMDSGAGDLVAHGNRFGRAGVFHIQISGARHGSGPLRLVENTFDDSAPEIFAEEGVVVE